MFYRTRILFLGFLSSVLVLTAGCVSLETQEEVFVPEFVRPERKGVYHKVKEGETLLLLEAMKMQNQIRMPFDGEIVKVHVKKDEIIPNRRLILEIKPRKL